MKKNKTDHYLIVTYAKFRLKWIKDLNKSPETIKYLGENISSKLLDIGLGNDFWTLVPKQKNKSKNTQVGLYQPGKLLHKMKKLPTYREKIFLNHLSDCFSVAQSCPTLCDCSTPGFPVLQHLLEFPQIHVHWVSNAIQPSGPLSSPSRPAFNLSQQQGLC